MRILAVDDDRYILELIPMLLAQTGHHEVALASSGEEALSVIAAATEPFDCFLFDIQMPGMDGIELCRRVRAIPVCSKVSIIMLTAMTEKPFIDRAFAAGATDYATKPFDLTELAARLRVADLLARASKDRAAEDALARQGSSDGSELDVGAISGVPNVVSVMALGNYLAALSTSGLLSTQVFAVEAAGFGSVAAKATPSERSYALTEIADSIATVLKPHGYFMAHVKDAAFVCISSSPTLLDPEDMEGEIGAVFDDRNCALDNGAPVNISFAVGQSMQPGLIRTLGAAPLFDRALARAQARAQALRNLERRPNTRRMPDAG